MELLRPEGGNPLGIGERDGRGRRLLHLLDVVKLAAMHDITRRAGVRPSDAAGAAVLVARQIEKMAPRDEYGSPLVDLQSLPQTLYLGLASVDGEMQVGLIDPFRPGGYLDVGRPSAAAHIVVPIAALLATVTGRVIGALT
ncbi:MAG TPA: hypothetical protein VHS58_02375 [Acetobacteraceae bacterium]|nr:hypothetical protein [Acetobacteraceae bacterium]